MARIRRVARKAPPPAGPFFDEQLWPVAIALVVLGGFLIGVSLAYQPLSGVAWHRTAWPSLVGIPLVVAGAIAALVRIESHAFRRSLQLSLVVCAIFHVALIVQMIETRMFAGLFPAAVQPEKKEIFERRPLKVVPEYHPTLLVPEESRPRQDFEKPVETQSPEPTREPERFVRQPLDEDRSPQAPQPVPVIEQQQTTEPNVVNRNRSNEAAPRLASQTSRLSRQVTPSEIRTNQSAGMPAAAVPTKPVPELQPAASEVNRQRADSGVAKRSAVAEPAAAANLDAQSQPRRRASEIAERPVAESPEGPKAARRQSAATPRTTTAAVMPAADRNVAVPASAVAEPTPSAAALQRSAAGAIAAQPSVTQTEATPSPASLPSAAKITRAARESPLQALDPQAAPGASPKRAVAAAAETRSPTAIDSPAATIAQAADAAPAPSRMALSRAQGGMVGAGRSPNVESGSPGEGSPALVASGALQRVESTQRGPTGFALSPSTASQVARARAEAELATAPLRAQPLETTGVAGATQVAEITASSSASLTRSRSDAKSDALTAAKGTSQIDLGPTQRVAEAGPGRAASGGGQAELSQATPSPQLARQRLASGEPRVSLATASVGEVAAPAGNSGGAPPSPKPGARPVVATRSTPGGAITDRSSPAPESAERAAGESTNSVAQAAIARAVAANDDSMALSGEATGKNERNLPAAKRASSAPGVAAPTTVAAIPEVGPRSAVAQAENDHLLSGVVVQSPMARRSDDALAIEVQAISGPGGLGADYTPEVGINTRQARADSLNVQLRSARFVRTQVGGVPAVSTSAIVSSEAFSSRGARASGDSSAGGRGSPEPQTEEAIERGLAFLARYQLPDGGWSLQGFPEGAQLASDTAATALAIIAFQGAGYHHREFQYKDVVRGGIDALLKGQKAGGDLFVPLDDASNRSVWLYSHSLAAIALCEAYGMTQDPALRQPAQKAIDFIALAQQPERGGWRYSPGVGADTSVSGWMMMALKSGELAGLNVPAGTYDKINRWLDDAQQSPSEPHLYRYNPYAPDSPEQRHGRTASKTMTAVGLLMRLYSGWRRENPNMLRGAAFLAENLPALGTTREPERDTYYWYYATQVMAHMGGDYWQTWFARLHPLLIDAQVRQGAYAGSWDPVTPIPDRWGPHAGRLYVTTMNLLSLEVQYRKLPLYDSAIR